MEKFLINESWEKNAKINKAEYEKLYSNSIENNDKFWNEFGQRIDWKKKYTKIKDVIYSKNKVDIKWFSILKCTIHKRDRFVDKPTGNL